MLPGVSVEVASSALIEKVRTTVTDGTGQYRFTDLRPGSYNVTFTLTGFATVRREGLEVSGAGVITINADMRVGGIQETVTVSGEAPVVDVQSSTKKQTVLDDSVIEVLAIDAKLRQPARRGFPTAFSHPGLNVLHSVPRTSFFTARGGRGGK